MWEQGVIEIPDKAGKNVSCCYWVKKFEEGSSWGINNGKISKLEIKIDETTVCKYERGWDIKPTCENAEIALSILLNEYN